ncbi:MAG: hypothetical protein NC930_01980, partial [Candidatus Omnitrophica bacterium]|nr:hypothetical protein [Candidatus Omnitrophota bacterium]
MAPFQPRTFVELSIRVRFPKPQTKTEITDFFLTEGFDPFGIVYFEYRSGLKTAVYVRSARQVYKIREDFELAREKGWRFEKKILRPCDWFHPWKRSYPITPVGTQFAAVPVWRKKEFRGPKIPIYLD